jgi:hypothetical protein
MWLARANRMMSLASQSQPIRDEFLSERDVVNSKYFLGMKGHSLKIVLFENSVFGTDQSQQ